MDMDFLDRKRLRDEAANVAYERAALICDEAAIRLLGGKARVNQVDRHTADVLRTKAAEIRALRTPTEDTSHG